MTSAAYLASLRDLAVQHHVDELAEDVGRLRRHPACEPETSLAHLADRLAHHIEDLDAILQPTAADLYTEFTAASGCEQTAAEEALRVTDARAYRVRSTLGSRRGD